MEISLAVVCKLNFYKLKLNYIAHQFLFFLCGGVSSPSSVSQVSAVSIPIVSRDWWPTMCFLSLRSINRANEEIAQVRTKAKAESAALHAGLRKEQMKVESLERALQQKVRGDPPRPLFFLLGCSSRVVWMKGAYLCADASIQLLWEVTQVAADTPRCISGTWPQAGYREEVALTEAQRTKRLGSEATYFLFPFCFFL